jgi:uncharacterized protein YhfF
MTDCRAEDFWRSFVDSLPPESRPPDNYSVWHFCDNQSSADALSALALRGVKKATCSLLWSYEADGEPVPQPGDFSVITDWAGCPQCVIQTIEVTIQPFDQVDDAFAYDEGEGDRSYKYWHDAHWQVFTRECQSMGKAPETTMPVVCERFRRVFP